MVKSQNPPTLKYLAFDLNGTTVYKGEGTANLVAYYPYGIDINETKLMPSSSATEVKATNLGDLEVPLKIKVPSNVGDLTISLYNEKGSMVGRIVLSSVTTYSGITHFLIDSKTCLIEGLNNNAVTGQLFNSCITSGDFFKLPPGRNRLVFSKECEKTISYFNLYY